MNALSKPIAVVLLLMSVGVAFHFLFGPFYASVLDNGMTWSVINYFQAVGVVVAGVFLYIRKLEEDKKWPNDGRVTRSYWESNIALGLAVLFFWNWIDVSTGERGGTNSIIWVVVDTLFILVVASAGCHLWRRPKQ